MAHLRWESSKACGQSLEEQKVAAVYIYIYIHLSIAEQHATLAGSKKQIPQFWALILLWCRLKALVETPCLQPSSPDNKDPKRSLHNPLVRSFDHGSYLQNYMPQRLGGCRELILPIRKVGRARGNGRHLPGRLKRRGRCL